MWEEPFLKGFPQRGFPPQNTHGPVLAAYSSTTSAIDSGALLDLTLSLGDEVARLTRSWRIYPDDKRQRSLCRLIDDYADEALGKVIKDYLGEANKPGSEQDEDALAKYRTLVQEQLANLNDLLGGQDFLVADRYTLADISVFSFLKILVIKGREELLSRYVNLYRWYKNVQGRYQGG